MPIRFSDITGGGIPFGNTAGRPTASTGKLYSNGETARLEIYTDVSGWQNIVQETPGVSSITGNYAESTNSGTITISGTNFVSGCYATAIGTNGVEVQAQSTTFNSLVQVTAIFTGLSNANEPYDIKVTNPSNLFGLLPDALYINANPAWVTSAGSLGSFAEQVNATIYALSVSDDSTITYSLANGSSLPSGVTLSSSGVISGTLPDVASNTTYTFTVNATDGLNPTISRTFSFISNAAPVWVTSAGSLGSFLNNTSITISALSATDSSDTVTYALASGSSLPAGLALNSSTGVISGTLPVVSVNTTYTFTINATDGINFVPREFSIASKMPVSVEYLIVAGGGGGGTNRSGGGGAGGLLTGTSALTPGTTYPITVGAKGTKGIADTSVNPTKGGNSTAFGFTSYGGGTVIYDNQSAANGGSGAGGLGGNITGGTGTVGQGNNGGNGGGTGGGGSGCGGGGGGYTAAGANASSSTNAGAGGAGWTITSAWNSASTLSGMSVLSSGGGGGAPFGTAGSGGTGAGNGGSGSSSSSTGNGTNATSYGSGGGGGAYGGGYSGGTGGDGYQGIVIVKSSSAAAATTGSPTLTTSGGNYYYQFAGDGSITY